MLAAWVEVREDPQNMGRNQGVLWLERGPGHRVRRGAQRHRCADEPSDGAGGADPAPLWLRSPRRAGPTPPGAAYPSGVRQADRPHGTAVAAPPYYLPPVPPPRDYPPGGEIIQLAIPLPGGDRGRLGAPPKVLRGAHEQTD